MALGEEVVPNDSYELRTERLVTSGPDISRVPLEAIRWVKAGAILVAVLGISTRQTVDKTKRYLFWFVSGDC